MTRIDLHPEELLDRALNGVASSEERTRLRAHLRICPACRLEHSVATDCRRSAAPRPDDSVVLERVRTSVVGAYQKRRYLPLGGGVRPRRIRLLAVAAVLLFTAFGTAAVLLRVYRASPRAMESPAPHASTPKATPSPTPAEIVAPATSTAEAPLPVADEHAAPSQHRAVAEHRAASHEEPPEGAKELFARANSLRREGATAVAVRVYRTLEQSFPASAESLIARVTLGRLLLDRAGNPSAALAEFDAYLGHASRGALAEEALIGRALALGRLGRAADERGAWERLLAEHPSSTYAARARARVERLSQK
jgi:hypothetical protein